MSPRFLLVSLALVGVPVTLPVGPAQAQGADDAINEARAKFQRGLELEQAGDYGGAVKLFREVGQVKMTPQVRYHIATCEENLGKLVVALGGYEIALGQSEGMNPAFIQEVEEAITELRARIPRVVIERGAGAEAATIELDGVTLGEKKIGVEVPLDPGPHTIRASAPGFVDYQETVVVEERKVERLSITLEPVPEGAAAPGAAEPVDEEPKGYGIVPFVVGGAGAALLATGIVLLPVSQGKAGEVEELCGGTNCEPLGDTDPDAWREARSLASQASTLETVGWISLGVGAAALGAGAVLYFLDPARNAEKPPADAEVTLRFVPSAARADVGFSLFGRF